MTRKMKREMIEVSAFLIMAVCFLILCDETEGPLMADAMKKIMAVLVIVATAMTRVLLIGKIRKN